MVRTSRKLPKDWEKYEQIGNVVPNTRLFAFKTPLRYELLRRYSREHRFTVPDLYRTLLFRNMPLGMIINATNTERYYDSREISNLSVEYRKLPISGRSFVESENLVKAFVKIVDDFLEQNNENDLLIGVHCTDGVNRAGYLICRYMIDRLGMSINDALNSFETSRGYKIERGSLVQALYRADRSRKMKSTKIESEEEEDESLQRRRKKKRQKDIVDDSFDPQTMQEIQSLVKTIKKMQSEQPPSNPYAPVEFSQMQMNSITTNNLTATSITLQQFHQGRSTPQQNLSQNISETSSPYIDDEEEDEEEDAQFDMSKLGRIDVKEQSAAQRRRIRRKTLKKKFDAMKRGRIWEINDLENK